MKQEKMGLAVTSAGQYAPDRYPPQHPNTQFLYRPDGLPATNQYCQSTVARILQILLSQKLQQYLRCILTILSVI